MFKRTVFMIVGLVAFVVPSAYAQRAEVSFNIGYSASEGVTATERPLLGQFYDTLAVDSGTSFNFTFGFNFNENMQGEFLFGRQTSKLQADGPAGKLEISDLAVYNYMFNFVYNFGAGDARVRPYAFGGLGATNYSFGDLLLPLPSPTDSGSIEGETRFSTNWGAGVKFFFTPNIGAKFGVRWTPTYIKSDSAGLWCDPFYGCWEIVDTDYSNQFETAVGITIRFE